jgi:hypothetical protein
LLSSVLRALQTSQHSPRRASQYSNHLAVPDDFGTFSLAQRFDRASGNLWAVARQFSIKNPLTNPGTRHMQILSDKPLGMAFPQPAAQVAARKPTADTSFRSLHDYGNFPDSLTPGKLRQHFVFIAPPLEQRSRLAELL